MAHSAQGNHGGHGTTKSYTIGFILSVILTLLAFIPIMNGSLTGTSALVVVIALAVVQLIVQLVYFLHLGTAKDERDNLPVFLFTVLIIAIIVGGSAWVLHSMKLLMSMKM